MNRRDSGINAAFIWCALIFSLLIGQSIFAQTGTSSVSGTVADPQGNVAVGATVTLTNPEKNFTRTQTTNETGSYSFSSIPPDTYTLEVSATGFKKAVLNDVKALVAKPTEANVQLEVGNVAETVTVTSTGNESLINTQDASLGNNIVSHQITQLPLEARDVNSLLTLQPGATREGYVAGARADQSNVTLDGVDINEAQTNQVGSPKGGEGANSIRGFSESPDAGTVLRLGGEAIEEFRVTTTNPNAAFGRSSGAQISLVTKSGSNNFHGALFEYNRDTAFTANDFFNNRSGIERPELKRNTFGGAIGGPIIKNRLFFFYSYEGRRDKSERTVVSRVPTASLGRGEIRYRNSSGGITTVTSANLATIFPATGGANPFAVAALAEAARKYPANDNTIGDGLNTAGFRFNTPVSVKLNAHVARFDYNLTSKQQINARVQIQQDLFGGSRLFPDTPSTDTWSHPWGIVVGHAWTINNSLVNNFRYGLTREAFTFQGDAAKNEIYFRNVFFPVNDSRTISRITPVQNIVDDLSWVKGNHVVQFGTNIRLIRNKRVTYSTAFDTAYTNPTGYASSGTPITNALNTFSAFGTGADRNAARDAAVALLGRLTAYTARFTFDREGNILPAGTPSERQFATEEYDVYAQDIWKIKPNLTLTYGLRYGISRPVYETNGYEVKPNIPLAEFFRRRVEGAASGVPYNDPISVELSGPENGRSPLYKWDKNNFQPRVAVAWSPNFGDGFLGTIFGKNSESVIRGGFGITNDYYGQQLAVSFDLNNRLGFSSAQALAAGTCNTTTVLCPLFTGFSQDVRSLPRITVPTSLTFPQMQAADNTRRIESSLDENLVAPIHYSWNLTFERSLPAGFVVQASYIGRAARNLLASRDVATANNLVDPRSGADWYTAAGMLEDLRRDFASRGITSSSSSAQLQAAIASIAAIPYFENLFANVPNFARNMLGSSRASWASNATQAVFGDALIFNNNDWVTTQSDIDNSLRSAGLSSVFYHPQYAALASVGSIGRSNYHAGTLSVRQRLGDKLTMDFNYTLSHSLDDASGLQTSGNFGTAMILNPIRQQDSYANSDFDVRHIINVNGVWQIPVGRNRWLLKDTNKVVDAFLGGWQLSGIFRWNSGLPTYSPYDTLWATNWNIQSNSVRLRPVESCPTRGENGTAPNAFGCDRTAAFQSWRNAKPGETGDRNVIRLPGYVGLDLGLAKSFRMPWGENHQLQIRAEGFNVTNTQRLGTVRTLQVGVDPQVSTPPSDWWNFTAIQGTPRVIQFGLRY
ncbi:MAG: carboxypeptidase-like regulatory domain-containing protein, partial [Acidobacteriota bacterium]|nr:carboxypeptidase-like regulatory domain-containing protein [Acidobacteriota bacterium]